MMGSFIPVVKVYMGRKSPFGARLREERDRLGLSQDQLAEMVGTTRKSIGSYEAGTSMPRADQLAAWAAAGVDSLYILSGERSEPKAKSISPLVDEALMGRIGATLKATGRKWQPDNFLTACTAVYNFLIEDAEEAGSIGDDQLGRVVRLVVNR